jgi:hypothetical protein
MAKGRTGKLGGSDEFQLVTEGMKMTIAIVREDGMWKLASLPPL